MSDRAFAVLRPQQVPDMLLDVVSADILSGRLRSNDRLREARIAVEMGVLPNLSTGGTY